MIARQRYKQPYVIKRVKKGEFGAHRSVSWKIAYADFVTALMAFFLLLWLYATLDSKQKIDISNYFTPSQGVLGVSGSGADGGKDESAPTGASLSNNSREGLVKNQLRQGEILAAPQDMLQSDSSADATSHAGGGEESGRDSTMNELFMAISDHVKQLMQDDPDSDIARSISISKRDGNLRLNLIDDPKKPMFESGSDRLTDYGSAMLTSLFRLIASSRHTVALSSHTATQGSLSPGHASSWDISVGRAAVARQMIADAYGNAECITQVVSNTDHFPLIPSEPANPRNNRIALTINNQWCMDSVRNTP